MSSPVVVNPASRSCSPLPGSPRLSVSPSGSTGSDMSARESPALPQPLPPPPPPPLARCTPPPRVPAIHPGLLHPNPRSHIHTRPSFMISDILNDVRPKHGRSPSPPLQAQAPPSSHHHHHHHHRVDSFRPHPLLGHGQHPGLPAHTLEALAAAEEARLGMDSRPMDGGDDDDDDELDVDVGDEDDDGMCGEKAGE